MPRFIPPQYVAGKLRANSSDEHLLICGRISLRFPAGKLKLKRTNDLSLNIIFLLINSLLSRHLT